MRMRMTSFHSFPCHSISQRNVSGAIGLVGYDSDGSDNDELDSGPGSCVDGFSTVFNGGDSGSDGARKAVLGKEVEAIGTDADP